MTLNKDQREEVQEMINEKNLHSEKLFLSKLDNLENKFDLYNANIINYINNFDKQNNEIQQLKENHLTRSINCPFKNEIINSTKYINEQNAIQSQINKKLNNNIKIAAFIITFINVVMIFVDKLF